MITWGWWLAMPGQGMGSCDLPTHPRLDNQHQPPHRPAKTQTSRLAAGYTFIQATMAIYGIDPTAREKARRILDTIPETASNHKVERNDDKYDDTDEDDDPDEWTVF